MSNTTKTIHDLRARKSHRNKTPRTHAGAAINFGREYRIKEITRLLRACPDEFFEFAATTVATLLSSLVESSVSTDRADRENR